VADGADPVTAEAYSHEVIAFGFWPGDDRGSPYPEFYSYTAPEPDGLRDEPPYHAPVFVLTHHPHEPVEMQGGTTFHFVTEGFDAAFAQARAAAGDLGVDIAGGASTVRQALDAGVVDELVLDVAPILLGSGERLFDGVGDLGLEPVEVLHSPLATHIRYRVDRR
jgi:dihydrofolate reductase